MPNALDEVKTLLRNAGFETIMDVSDKAASYCRSIGEAAYRGDELTVEVHLKQLRLCCLAMIKTFKEDVGGQGMAEGGRPQADGEDQRSGDGVARGQPE